MENNHKNQEASQVRNSAKDIIKSHLDARAAKDSFFAASYSKPKKNIDECFNFILNEARKRGNSVCLTDDEVFGLAVHYYDEDDINVDPAPSNYITATSRKSAQAVELTEEEKAIAREAAIRRYEEQCMAEEAERATKRKKAEAERRRAEAEKRKEQMITSPSLFNFEEI